MDYKQENPIVTPGGLYAYADAGCGLGPNMLRGAASAWEADRKRLEALHERCSAPGVDILPEDFIDNSAAWLKHYKAQIEELQSAIALLRESLRWHDADMAEEEFKRRYPRLAPNDTSQANPSPKSPEGDEDNVAVLYPMGTDIVHECPECSVPLSTSRCPHCQGE